jgi:hypothetical protein
MKRMENNQKYCFFIDVLGYGSIVNNKLITFDRKVSILKSIFEDLASSIVNAVRDINDNTSYKIHIRSFSDSFYLYSDNIKPLIYAINKIFENAFGLYSNFSEKEERTPLIRAGIVKDWMLEFKDIGGLLNGHEEINPVGLGVARAYYTSEKSNLSGMRIIIAKEVIDDLYPEKLESPFIHYKTDIDIFDKNTPLQYYFKPVIKDEKENNIDLYELIWSYTRYNDSSYDYANNLVKIEGTFTVEHKRHFYATARVLFDGLQLDSKNYNDNRHKEAVKKIKKYLL